MSCAPVSFAISADNYRFVSAKSGGAIYDNNGAEVFIPENILSQDDYLIFYRISDDETGGIINTSSFKTQSLSDFKSTNIIYNLKSTNQSTKLLNSVSIKIPYAVKEINNVGEDNLRIYYYDSGTWMLLKDSKINTDAKYVEAEFDKLGYYGLFGYIGHGGVFDDSLIYTYPNPARGDKLVFKFLLNYNSDVEIDVYDVAGELIKKLTKEKCGGGLINEIEWNIKNIASGVYVYLFKADGEGGKKKITKKLAVIK
jgi:hypothetical protein